MHSLGIVQWNSTRRDHLGNPEGVSGSGPVIDHISPNSLSSNEHQTFCLFINVVLELLLPHINFRVLLYY